MKKNLIILFLAVLTIINVAALVTIAYHRFQPRKPFPTVGPPDNPINFIKQELGLSEEQAKKFEDHFKKFQGEMDPILDSLKVKRSELMDGISAERPDMDKVTKLIGEVGRLENEMQKKIVMNMLEEKSFLTPEQQKKFFSIFKQGKDRERGPMGRGGGMGTPPKYPDFGEGK
jgi:Spy/CpxP family protein refolding chaperone